MARDLFGDPVDPRRGMSGRPRHMPTDAQRQIVRDMHQEGQAQPAIAAALGITVPTLVLNYPIELESTSRASARRKRRDQTKGATQ